MSNHNPLPNPVRNIRARLRSLLRPVFWGPAVFLVLGTVFMWDYLGDPQQLVEIKNLEGTRANNPNKAADLSKDDMAKVADIDNVSVLLKDLKRLGNQSTSAVNKANQGDSRKGLFEEIQSRQGKNAAPTPSAIDSSKKPSTGDIANEKTLELPASENATLNLNAAGGIDVSEGKSPYSPLPGSPSEIENYSPIPTNIDSLNPSQIGSLNSTQNDPPITSINSLQSAIEKYQTGAAQTPFIPVYQSSVPPLSYPTTIPFGQNPNPSNASYIEAATGLPSPTVSRQNATPNYGLVGTTGSTLGVGANTAPGNAYTYLTGSQIGNPTAGTSSVVPGALSNYGQSPINGLNSLNGLRNLPGTSSVVPGASSNYGQSAINGLNSLNGLRNLPGTSSVVPSASSNYRQSPINGLNSVNGLTTTAPELPSSSAPIIPSNYGQSPINGLNSVNGLTTTAPELPSSSVPVLPSNDGRSPINGLNSVNGLRSATEDASTVLGTQNNYGQSPGSGLNQRNGLGNSTGGLQYNDISPNGRSPLPSFNQNTGTTTPGYPYNSGNQGVQNIQPTQQPFSVPRPIPGRNIGGGQINTFSNP